MSCLGKEALLCINVDIVKKGRERWDKGAYASDSLVPGLAKSFHFASSLIQNDLILIPCTSVWLLCAYLSVRILSRVAFIRTLQMSTTHLSCVCPTAAFLPLNFLLFFAHLLFCCLPIFSCLSCQFLFYFSVFFPLLHQLTANFSITNLVTQ